MAIRKGDSGEEVVRVQRALQQFGFQVDDDGDFGSRTEAAVEEFQRQQGLDDDGVVGPATLAALGLDGSSGDEMDEPPTKVIVFEPNEVDVPAVVAKSIDEYVDELGRQFELIKDTSKAALENFQTTMVFASTKEANPDLLGSIGSRVFDFAVDKLIGALEDRVPGLGLAKAIFDGASEELERAGRAKASASIGEWVKDQRDELDRLQFDAARLREDISLEFLESTDKSEYADGLFQARERLRAQVLPDVSDLEVRFYEGWINAQFSGISDEASGCIEYRYEFEDNEFDFVSCTVKSEAGDKLEGAFNRVFEQGRSSARRPIDLKVHKRACFRTENFVGGTSWFCGWLNQDNEVVHEPIKDIAEQAFHEPIWMLADRFRR